MRFTLDLFEPNKKDFPQFNFSTLTRIEKVMSPDYVADEKKIMCVCVRSSILRNGEQTCAMWCSQLRKVLCLVRVWNNRFFLNMP